MRYARKFLNVKDIKTILLEFNDLLILNGWNPCIIQCKNHGFSVE